MKASPAVVDPRRDSASRCAPAPSRPAPSQPPANHQRRASRHRQPLRAKPCRPHRAPEQPSGTSSGAVPAWSRSTSRSPTASGWCPGSSRTIRGLRGWRAAARPVLRIDAKCRSISILLIDTSASMADKMDVVHEAAVGFLENASRSRPRCGRDLRRQRQHRPAADRRSRSARAGRARRAGARLDRAEQRALRRDEAVRALRAAERRRSSSGDRGAVRRRRHLERDWFRRCARRWRGRAESTSIRFACRTNTPVARARVGAAVLLGVRLRDEDRWRRRPARCRTSRNDAGTAREFTPASRTNWRTSIRSGIRRRTGASTAASAGSSSR